MGCRHYFVVDRLEDLVDEGGSRSSWTSSRTRKFSACFTTECGNPDILKSMSTLLNVEDELGGCPLTTGPPVLSWFASTSKLAFLQSREKRASISWLLERDVFSATTGHPLLSWFGFGFGLLLVEQLLNPIPFIQSCFKEIFGGSRGDAYTFSYMISTVSIRTTFGIQ